MTLKQFLYCISSFKSDLEIKLLNFLTCGIVQYNDLKAFRLLLNLQINDPSQPLAAQRC